MRNAAWMRKKELYRIFLLFSSQHFLFTFKTIDIYKWEFALKIGMIQVEV